MPIVKLLNESELETWDHFVLNHEDGSIYHTSMWRKIIMETYGHFPMYLALIGEGGDIIGGMPMFFIKGIFTQNRLSSVPCAQVCNPLFEGIDDCKCALKYLDGLVKEFGCKYVEIRTSGGETIKPTSVQNCGHAFHIYVLRLDRPLEVIMKSFHKSCIQRQIKKSFKTGLKLVKGKSENDVKTFYKLYAMMRKRNGMLPHPLRFFLAMWRVLQNKGHMAIYHAERGGEIASSILLLKYKNKTTYEYGASDPEMLNLGPSHFLLWQAIKEAAISGYKEFDFGRTSENNIGLSEFKARWGTKKETLMYYLLFNQSGARPVRENRTAELLMKNVITRAPLRACELAGRFLYRYLI